MQFSFCWLIVCLTCGFTVGLFDLVDCGVWLVLCFWVVMFVVYCVRMVYWLIVRACVALVGVSLSFVVFCLLEWVCCLVICFFIWL